MILIDRRFIANFDWGLFGMTMVVPLLGLIVLFSAGYDPDAAHKSFLWVPEILRSIPFLKQVVFIGAGLIAMAIGLSIPPTFFYRISYFLYGIGIVLLLIVAKFGIVVNGSRRWLHLGPVNLQPAELMKLAVILVMARYLSGHLPKAGGYRLKSLIVPFLVFTIPMGLIIKQPDLGTSLAVGGVGFLMTLFVGIHWRTLLIIVVACSAAAFPVWHKLHDYQQKRILLLFDPGLDPKGSGYHIDQSKIAVGSGSVFGKGFLNGTQTQLEFLPEHTTDFIFSVLAEEWGFVGCFVVLVAYFGFLYRLIRVAVKTKELYSALMVVGISSLIFFHSAINIGMVVGILPVVGIPLPLFSYGGSSVISTMFGVGIVLGVSMRRFNYKSSRS